MVVLLELLTGGVLCEEQFGEALEVVNRARWKGVEPVGGYSLQAEGEDPAQNGVISSMDHYLVLILAEMLHRALWSE